MKLKGKIVSKFWKNLGSGLSVYPDAGETWMYKEGSPWGNSTIKIIDRKAGWVLFEIDETEVSIPQRDFWSMFRMAE